MVKEWDAAFEPFRPTLEKFSQSHGMHLQKYYHDSPVWDLLTDHPQGGTVKLQVEISESQPRIHAMWWIDSLEDSKRYSKFSGRIDVYSELEPALQRALEVAFTWEPGAWDKVTRIEVPI